jgi:hypothetical protein
MIHKDVGEDDVSTQNQKNAQSCSEKRNNGTRNIDDDNDNYEYSSEMINDKTYRVNNNQNNHSNDNHHDNNNKDNDNSNSSNNLNTELDHAKNILLKLQISKDIQDAI